MENENPRFVVVNSAKRARARMARGGNLNEWESIQEDYHRGEIGIFHEKLKQYYMQHNLGDLAKERRLPKTGEPIVPISRVGIRGFPFEEEQRYHFIGHVSPQDNIILLFDKDKRITYNGFYAISLDKKEFKGVNVQNDNEIINQAESVMGMQYSQQKREIIERARRELCTFETRYYDRLSDVPLEIADKEISKKELEEIAKRHAPIEGGFISDRSEKYFRVG